MNSGFSSRVATWCLVTGAAGGIGRTLTEVFLDAGYRVIASDRAPPPEGLSCTDYLQCDLEQFVRDPGEAERFLADVRGLIRGDGLKVLVNNAAVQIFGGAESLGRDDWRSTLDVNVVAPFLLIQGLLADLAAVKGSVINIGSIHARLTKRDFVAYATSKAAIAGLTRALAVDLGPRVRINAIEPAAIATEMLRAGFADRPELYRRLSDHHPQRCIGEPGEVARLALALASGGMSFLHGACIGLDGGIGARLHDPD